VETLNANRTLAGRLTDATLGTTTAKALYNLRASADSLPGQFANPQLDSVVLVSSFDQVYGSASKPFRADIYRLAASLDDKKTYNASVTDVALGDVVGTNLSSSLTRTKTEERANGLKKIIRDANGAKIPGSVDSTTTVTVPDQTVRLVIQKTGVRSSDFANTLFTALKDATFAQAKLNDVLKGLAVVPAGGQTDAIVAFNRQTANRLYVYFHATRGGKTHTPAPYTIRLGTSYTATDPNAPRYYTQLTTALKMPFDQLADGSKSVRLADSTTYMQQGLGLATRLIIPGLAALKDQPTLAINRAELIIPVKSASTLIFPNPTQAFLYEINARNRVLQRTVNISPVERIVQANLFSPIGKDNEAIVTLYDLGPTNKYYSVLITTYLQAYLANQLGEQAAGLMLSPVLRRSFDLSLNRGVLDAQNIRLRVYSSKLR
jgi:Domain of unknown function (DUF4270)